MTRACAYCGALVTDRSDGRRVDADTGEPHQHSTASPLPPREGETEAAPDTSVGESEAAADAPAKGDGADFAANDEKVRALLDGAEPPIPSATSPPTTGGLVGGEVMEATGDELIAFAEHARELPMLPLLGQEKYIVEGWSHLLAGYPRSGKTELLFRAIREWLDEGRSVVYLTEEPRSIWEQRLRRRSGDWSNLHVAFALGTPPEVLFRRAFEGEEEIVIVDTLRNLLNLRDETDNSEVARVLNPWVAGARRAEKTLIMAHHMRKGGGKRGEGISGGHALLGVFDIALELGWDDQPRGPANDQGSRATDRDAGDGVRTRRRRHLPRPRRSRATPSFRGAGPREGSALGGMDEDQRGEGEPG